MPEAQVESTTDLYVPTVDNVTTRAYRRAGLVNVSQAPTAAQLNTGRELLMDLVDKLSAEGIFMRQVQPGYVLLVQGQNQYTLPEDVIDIEGNGAYIDPTQSQVPFQAQSETPVIMKPRDTWQDMSAKSAVSRPTLGYFARNAPLSTLYIWPIPGASEVGGQIRFQFQKERPDLSAGTNTLPFERYWTAYFVWALAAVLAIDNSLPLDRVQLLSGEAAANLAICKAYSKQNVSVVAKMTHMTGWTKRRW
jgi:hypothetical protein